MRILSVLAHPDDEIIFGWPVFQHVHLKKHLICASGCGQRLAALQKSSEMLNFSWECLDLPYDNISNYGSIIQNSVREYICRNNPSLVFTHNPHGEYSHPDHISVFQNVYNVKEIEMLMISDMSISLHGSGFPETPLSIPENEKKYFYHSVFCQQIRNDIIYNKIKHIYKHFNSWTWGKRTIDIAKLFFVKQELNHRKYVIDLLSSFLCPYNCSIAEIGVYKGITSEYLASCSHISDIYAIDPWAEIEEYGDCSKLLNDARRENSHGEKINITTWSDLYNYVHKKLSIYPNIHILREKSQNAAEKISDVDCVFIDGDHSYEQVKKDIELWATKIKSKGLIIGHDYSWNAEGGTKRGLCIAVNEYFERHNDEFEEVLDPERHLFINKDRDRVWWRRKK